MKFTFPKSSIFGIIYNLFQDWNDLRKNWGKIDNKTAKIIELLYRSLRTFYICNICFFIIWTLYALWNYYPVGVRVFSALCIVGAFIGDAILLILAVVVMFMGYIDNSRTRFSIIKDFPHEINQAINMLTIHSYDYDELLAWLKKG